MTAIQSLLGFAQSKAARMIRAAHRPPAPMTPTRSAVLLATPSTREAPTSEVLAAGRAERGAPAAGCCLERAPARTQAPPSRAPKFILVVEADPVLCARMAWSLEAAGYLVLTAHSVREASDQLAVQPALLILDPRLPDASGWDLLDWLAVCDRSVPTVIVGAEATPRRRSARVCPVQFLRKPFVIETLVAVVQEHVLSPTTAFGM